MREDYAYRSMIGIARWLAVVVAAVALVACTTATAYNKAYQQTYAQPGRDGLAIGKGAVFYLEQSGKHHWFGNTNGDVASYHVELASCFGDPTTPLSLADEGKLGYQRTQIWLDGPHRRAAVLQEGYKVVMGGSIEPPTCTFTLEHTRVLQLWLSDHYYHIDLTKRSGYVMLVGSKRLTSHRATQLGARRIGQSSVAGQPCTVWHIDDENSQYKATWCTWSGGKQWGMPDDELQDFPDFHGTPVLAFKNAAGSLLGGDHTTVRFVVGSLPDTAIFTVPSDVKIESSPGTSTAVGIFASPSGVGAR